MAFVARLVFSMIFHIVCMTRIFMIFYELFEFSWKKDENVSITTKKHRINLKVFYFAF